MYLRADEIINANPKQGDYEDLLEKDPAMQKIYLDIQNTKKRCGSKWLDEYMDDVKMFMLKSASSGILSTAETSITILDIAHRSIREYINKMKSRNS